MGLSHDQPAPLPVGFQIDPRNQLVAQQEGQDIITKLPLFRRNIDFDPVAKAEQALGAVAFPDQRIERGQQCLSLDPARATGVAMQPGMPPAGYIDRNEYALFSQRLDGGIASSGDWRK
jgi:hypothetical protein